MTRNQLALFAAFAAFASAGPASAQTAATGAAYFTGHCQMCHTNSPGQRNGVGPNLFGVGNRKAGTASGFGYTDALKSSKLVWTQKNLDQFLTMPGAMVPGTMMVVSIPDAGDRKGLVAYLMSLKK
jgi:cytochrome c